MKNIKLIILLLLNSALSATYAKDTHSLVFLIKYEDDVILNKISLSDVPHDATRPIKMTEEHIVDEEVITNVIDCSDEKIDLEHLDAVFRGQEVLCKVKISDLKNGYAVFALKRADHYEAYIIANDMLEVILHKIEDKELDEIGRIIGDEKIELPTLPFPPAVSRVIVATGMYMFLSYHYVKDSISSLYKKIMLAVRLHQHETK